MHSQAHKGALVTSRALRDPNPDPNDKKIRDL
jgi:hypothetical protein